MKFDDILENYVGEFGRYQKRVYFLVCIPATFAAIFTLLPVFILITPDHRCQLDGLENDTFAYHSETHKQLVEMSIPRDENDDSKLSSCQLYDWDNDTSSANASKSSCNEWVYDTSVVTAVSAYNMVCEYSIYQSHFKMISFLGGLLGAFLNGLMSDIFGRKRAFLVCLALYMIVTVILIFSPTYNMFLAMRFFQGLCGIGIFMISFVMVMELVGPSYRMIAGMVIEFFWCFGLFVLVGAAYFIRSWKNLFLVVSAPCIIFFSYIWVIPESPRWLLSRGRVDEAEAILKKAASINGTDFPERLVLEQVKQEETVDKSQQRKEAGHVWKLFTHRVLLVRMLIIIFNRFTLNMAYYGLWLNIEYLSGNVYLNFTISSVVETVANVFIFFFINRLGRKPLHCGSMVTSAVGFLLTLFPIYFGQESDKIYGLGLLMIGKFGLTAAYSIVFIYTAELVPTSLRNSAMGLSQCIEVFGGVLSPYIIDVGNLFDERSSRAFPMIVFGSLSLVAGILSLLLPETKNKQLPDTVEEAAKFGRHVEV